MDSIDLGQILKNLTSSSTSFEYTPLKVILIIFIHQHVRDLGFHQNKYEMKR
jgi:hypothetical protein